SRLSATRCTCSCCDCPMTPRLEYRCPLIRSTCRLAALLPFRGRSSGLSQRRASWASFTSKSTPAMLWIRKSTPCVPSLCAMWRRAQLARYAAQTSLACTTCLCTLMMLQSLI
ncbi:hypothetical protein GGF41_008654, partial [Coemansia sp. RSA 2531]